MEPEPKYRIGHKVWLADWERVVRALPCPDCLDQNEWEATTPAGDTIKFRCPRCYYLSRDKPQKIEWIPRVLPMTIGSIRIDTSQTVGKVVSYMCEETGVGTGRIHYESSLFPDEDLAREAADLKCRRLNSEEHSQPKVKHSELLARVPFSLYVAVNERSKAWDYQFKLQDVQRIAYDDSLSDEEVRRWIKEELETIEL